VAALILPPRRCRHRYFGVPAPNAVLGGYLACRLLNLRKRPFIGPEPDGCSGLKTVTPEGGVAIQSASVCLIEYHLGHLLLTYLASGVWVVTSAPRATCDATELAPPAPPSPPPAPACACRTSASPMRCGSWRCSHGCQAHGQSASTIGRARQARVYVGSCPMARALPRPGNYRSMMSTSTVAGSRKRVFPGES
jgi:hypothetical protein